MTTLWEGLWGSFWAPLLFTPAFNPSFTRDHPAPGVSPGAHGHGHYPTPGHGVSHLRGLRSRWSVHVHSSPFIQFVLCTVAAKTVKVYTLGSPFVLRTNSGFLLCTCGPSCGPGPSHCPALCPHPLACSCPASLGFPQSLAGVAPGPLHVLFLEVRFLGTASE